MIALGLTIALALAYGLYALRRFDLMQLHDFEECAKAFHAASAPLIADDETPEEVLRFLAVFNKRLSDPKAARAFLHHVASKKVGPHGPPAVVRDFFNRRPELEEKFLEAIAAAISAMSYRSRFWGYKLRLWFSAIETNEKKEEIGASFKEFACAA